MYNNETGQYEECDWLEKGDWFEDGMCYLYIVPLPDEVAEVEGPDNEVMEKICSCLRDHGRLTDLDCELIGLTRIPDTLKRFSPEEGYYHA